MTQRDWQKDWERTTMFDHLGQLVNNPFPIPHKENYDSDLVLLKYWLQEAKEQKERADRVTEERQRFNQVYEMLLKKFHAAERREQQLKEAAYSAWLSIEVWHSPQKALSTLSDVLSTLSPDTPAPKEEEEHKCPGCGSHMVPQWGGDEGPESHWEECQNPDCDYEEGDNQ